MRQRVVTGAHDDDAVARAREFHKFHAAGGSVCKEISFMASTLHGRNYIAAADAAVRGAAKIDGVGHHEDVASLEVARESLDESILHLPQRAVSVGLE